MFSNDSDGSKDGQCNGSPARRGRNREGFCGDGSCDGDPGRDAGSTIGARKVTGNDAGRCRREEDEEPTGQEDGNRGTEKLSRKLILGLCTE